MRIACVYLPSKMVDKKAVSALLQNWSPEVEPARVDVHAFWLNAEGLLALYPSLEHWAKGLHAALRMHEANASVVVGFDRFFTYALAKNKPRVRLVLGEMEQEQTLAHRVPLQKLLLDKHAVEKLNRLNIRTLGELIHLPYAGLLERFGHEVAQLWNQTQPRKDWQPWTPLAIAKPILAHHDLEAPDTEWTRLLFMIKGRLGPLLKEVRARSEAVKALHLDLKLSQRATVRFTLEPAEPTLEEKILVELVQLKLGVTRLQAPVEELDLHVQCVRAHPAQLGLFKEHPRRGLEGAARALARLRAEFGQDSVVRAHIANAHLPERSFEWKPYKEARNPLETSAGSKDRALLIRRLFQPPESIPEPESTTLRSPPEVLSGGWWQKEVHRTYYFRQTTAGDLEWVFYDSRRNAWFLHAVVQ